MHSSRMCTVRCSGRLLGVGGLGWVSALRGVCPEGCLPRRVSARGQGVSTQGVFTQGREGVSDQGGGGGLPRGMSVQEAGVSARPPLPCGQNARRLRKHNLSATTIIKIPHSVTPQFTCSGMCYQHQCKFTMHRLITKNIIIPYI